MKRPIRIVGGGFCGATGAAAFLRAGHHVTIVDTDPVARARLIEAPTTSSNRDIATAIGHSLRPYHASGQLTLTSDWTEDLALGTVLILALPTEKQGQPWMDLLKAWWSAFLAAPAGQALVDAVIVESTCVPGTVDWMLEQARASDAYLGPIAIAPRRDWFGTGQTIDAVTRVVGVVGPDRRGICDLLRSVSGGVIEGSYRAVELSKPLENALLMVPLSYALGVAWAYPDVDMVETMALVGTHFARPHYTLPAGIAGYCVPPAPKYVAEGHGDDGRGGGASWIAGGADMAQQTARALLTHKLLEWVREGGAIACYGLGYKPGYSVLHAAPAVEITRVLQQAGRQVWATDPILTPPQIQAAVPGMQRSLPDPIDLAILWTAHPQLLTETCALQLTARAKRILDIPGAWGCYAPLYAQRGQKYVQFMRAGWSAA